VRLRALFPVAVLGLVALGAVTAPALTSSPSAAAFSDSATLSANTATAASCPSTTSWTSLVNAAFTGSDREQWQTLSTTTSAVPNHEWNDDSWSESSLVTNQPGALYCSDDSAISLDATSDRASSRTKSYSTWSANSTITTLLWLRGTSTAAGRLVTLAEGASGSTRYAERALWVTSTGGLVAGGRYSSSSSWTTATSDVTVNDGRWHLLAVVWTNTASSNVAPTILVDGIATETTTTGTVTYRARSSSGTSAAWYLGANNAGRLPSGAPTAAYRAAYDEFLVVRGTPSATLLGDTAGSLYAAADR
jgi:hypothetical protein